MTALNADQEQAQGKHQQLRSGPHDLRGVHQAWMKTAMASVCATIHAVDVNAAAP